LTGSATTGAAAGGVSTAFAGGATGSSCFTSSLKQLQPLTKNAPQQSTRNSLVNFCFIQSSFEIFYCSLACVND
jgi:hypothetical protein